jgi:hypothetical protein
MRRIAFVTLVGLLLGSLVGITAILAPNHKASAADPPSGTVTAKDEGSDTLSYKGVVPPGAGSFPGEHCEDDVNADFFKLKVEGPTKTFYKTHTALLTARIDWDPTSENPDTTALNDLALILRKKQKDGSYETVESSDGGESKESVAIQDPGAGRYLVIACAFASVDNEKYLGVVSLNTQSKAVEKLPRASGDRGLRFMPIVTVDPQRDVAEPSLRIDKAGNFYTCGPFGASRTSDYAQKSEDGGDTFRVLGEPPEGKIALGGGGDCEISVAPKKNAQGNYNLSYAGLAALLNFSTGKSADEGRIFLSAPVSESIALVDRQWLESHGGNEVYLFYNQIPFGGTLQRSTDGGLTYALASEQGNAAPSIYRPGNIVIDHDPSRNPDAAGRRAGNETLYIAYTDDLKVRISRSTDQGETFERFTAGVGEGNPANLFPSLAIDKAGNLYASWIEKGSFNVYYSYSKDHGETWAPKQLVNRRGALTNTMPWIEAGSPGRVAVSFYCSPVDGNPEVGAGPERFKGPWHVCVNQSTNALSRSADFSQVRATHHPIHWDSICLSGLACSFIGGDRTLLDFFQIRADPRNGRLFVVYNESNKIPAHIRNGKKRERDTVGEIAIITLSKQKSGPSLLAREDRVDRDRRRIVRSVSFDPPDDALFDFSSLGPPEPVRQNIKALDIRKLKVSPTTIEKDGKTRRALKIRLKLRTDLTDATLAAAMAQMSAIHAPPTEELKFVVRWFSSFKPDYVIANWNLAEGFTFAEGNLRTKRCETTEEGKLEIYPAPARGRASIPGKVNEKEGVITMKMPYAGIQDFDYGEKLTSPPIVESAKPGDKIYEVTAFTFGRVQPPDTDAPPDPAPCSIADYYNQADSTPSFDHKLRAPK